MSLHEWIGTYGYVCVFVGTLLEGDIALITGGYVAALSPLPPNLFGIILAAFLGAYSLDQFFFYLGRGKGLWLLKKFPRMHARAERVFYHLRRHCTLIAIGFRFAYGFRILTPLLLGTSGISRLRFAILNALGAATWATIMGTLGYVLGRVMLTFLEGIKHRLKPALLILLIGFLLVRLTLHVVRRRAAPVPPPGVLDDIRLP